MLVCCDMGRFCVNLAFYFRRSAKQLGTVCVSLLTRCLCLCDGNGEEVPIGWVFHDRFEKIKIEIQLFVKDF